MSTAPIVDEHRHGDAEHRAAAQLRDSLHVSAVGPGSPPGGNEEHDGLDVGRRQGTNRNTGLVRQGRP